MIEIEQLSDLENIDIIKIVRTKNIWSYKQCVSDISVKQCDLLYFIRNLKNAYSNVLFPPEQIEHSLNAANPRFVEEKKEMNQAIVPCPKNECSICMSTIEKSAYIACFHEFCIECIKKYIDSNIKNNRALICPICRASIKKDIIKDINRQWIDLNIA